MIPLIECKVGHAYKLRSRNLSRGVFNGQSGFIGIREKFGSRFLFTEYHWDTGAPHGTAQPYEDTGRIPDGIVIADDLGTVDTNTGRLIAWDNTAPAVKGQGNWYFIDTKEPVELVRPAMVENKGLFDYLDSFGFEYIRCGTDETAKE